MNSAVEPGRIDLVRAAQEARRHVLLLSGLWTNLGDRRLKILDRCAGLHPEVQRRRTDDRCRGREGRCLNPRPSAAGTGVQSQPGSASHALPFAGRLVRGRTLGSSVNGG